METNEVRDLVASLDAIAATLEREARALRSVMSFLNNQFVKPASGE